MTPYIHTYHVNVRDGADIRRERHPLASGDKNADTFVVYLRDHDSVVSLAGAGVSGKVIRPDGQTVPLTGKVVDGAAQVTLDEACYEVPGEIKLTVTVSAGDMTQSVLIVMMDVQTCETSVIVDNGVIGTLSDLLAEIANMRAATSAANAAANRANQAADFYDSGIRAAMLNGVITDGIVPYWGSSAEMDIGRDNYPAENIGVVRHGGTAVLNGTATASVRVTMSGDLARTATNADFSALARTVDLVYGREYELEIRLISGSITGTDLRCIVYDVGTNAVASAVLDAAATGRGVTRFTWENGVTDAIIALRIPEGMSFTDCEVCCVLTDVEARAEATADTTARAAVKALEETHNEDYAYTVNLIAAAGAQSVNEASKKVAALSDDLTPMLEAVDPIARDSEGHFYPLIWTNTTEVTTYSETDGVIGEHTAKPLGSGIMPCPKNLFFEFANSSSRLWLYFYTANGDGTYTPNWDVLNLTTSTNLKNYLNSEYGRKAIRDIPDGLYIQAAVAAGDVKVYGWDGESFGPPITSNTNIITTSGNTNNFMADGNGSVIVPGDSRYLVVTDNRAKLRAGIAVKDGVSTYLGSSETEFIVLPEGYDYFMFRLDPNAGVKMSWTGDASKYVSAVCRMQRNRMAETGAQYVIDAAKKICGFSWTPAAQIRAQGASKPFYPGVQYNGIPYGSGWQVAHFVGWHVSPHTYINAVADDASIMVAEGLGDGGEAPYYSTVCSAFAVMAAGWPHPVLNDGMAVNPRVKLVRSVVPPIGAVWSNIGKSGGKHCVIPERIDYIGENVRSYSSYEGLPATSMRTTRYSNVTNAGDKTAFKLAAGASYFDAYGAAAYHVDAVRDMSNIPYWDADAAVVTGGAARPYRGDKSVYTSTMDSVLINIKDPEATRLLLRSPEGGTHSIDINGETQIDVKNYTISDGIYYVYTNTSVVEESFEYVNVVPYNCTITNGQATFDRNDFWYAYTEFRTNPGNAYYPHTKDIYVNIPSNSGGDYSDWASVGRCYDVVTVFCKGQYGAYTVPCNTTVINNVPESGGSISLDTTLTQPGMAADAAAVGEAVNGLAEEIEALKESGGSGSGSGGIVTETDPTVPAWAKQPDPPTYTAEQVGALPSTYVPPDQTAEQVGADPAGTAVAAVGEHNTSEDAHNDIRLLLADLDKRLGTLADSDDTTLDQLSEIVAYIKSNKSLIDGITTGKISTADIVDNLTTNAANKPLSAAQGVALKKLIDAIVVPTKLSELSDDATHRLTTDTEKAAWNAKSTFSGKYEDLTGKPTIPTVTTASITSALGYTPANAETVTELSKEIDTLEGTSTDHESRLTLLEANTSGSGVPDYWLDELEAKADAIQQAMEAAGRNKSAFLWYTDAHWPNGNSKMSPVLLDYLYRHTAMNKVNFGGDIIGDSLLATRDDMTYLYEWREAIRGLPNHHSVAGNHDMFASDSVDYEDDNYRYAFLLAPEESYDMVMGDGLYYYIDNPAERTRYLHLAYITGNQTAMLAQGQFICDAIKGVSDGWHIIAIAHRWWQYSSSSTPTTGSIPTYEAEILSIFDAYNARETRSGSNYFYAQDFTDAAGKVEFCIGGHIHVDYDFETAGGIPVIITTADTNQDRVPDSTVDSGTLGTTTEAAVFGIIADYNDTDNTKITVVGVGRGTSRVVRKSDVKPVSISDITYSGDTTVGATIDKSLFAFTVEYSNGATDTINGATSISPATIGVVGDNAVTVTYTEGTVTVSGTATIVGTAVPVANLFDATDADLVDRGRINSSGAAVAYADNQLVTGYIDAQTGDTFTVVSDLGTSANSYVGTMACFDSDKGFIGSLTKTTTVWTWSTDTTEGTATVPSTYNSKDYSVTAYVRFCVAYTDMDSIVITKS